MSYPQAIVLAAAILATAALLSSSGAAQSAGDRGALYQIHGSENAAWRLNVSSGEIVHCRVTLDQVMCRKVQM